MRKIRGDSMDQLVHHHPPQRLREALPLGRLSVQSQQSPRRPLRFRGQHPKRRSGGPGLSCRIHPVQGTEMHFRQTISGVLSAEHRPSWAPPLSTSSYSRRVISSISSRAISRPTSTRPDRPRSIIPAHSSARTTTRLRRRSRGRTSFATRSPIRSTLLLRGRVPDAGLRSGGGRRLVGVP